MSAVAVLVLAGGEGRRIGGGKPLRRLGGSTLLERALATARGFSDRVAIAADVTEIGPQDVPVLADLPDCHGPLGGLAAGLAWAGEGRLLTLPCDLPFAPADLLDRLAAVDAPVVVPASGGFLHPVCALWEVSVLEAVPVYRASGRRSLKGLAEDAGQVAVEWPTAPFDPFFNVNTEDDLATAEAMLWD